jgi:CBS domain-containing protein
MKVREAMSPDVQLCTPDDTLKDAAEAMAALGVGLLPVADNECLVGMISDRDIAIRGSPWAGARYEGRRRHDRRRQVLI